MATMVIRASLDNVIPPWSCWILSDFGPKRTLSFYTATARLVSGFALQGKSGNTNLCRVEYGLPADEVVTALHALPANEVDLAREDGRKLVLHINQIEQIPMRVSCEGDKHINVAIRPKIVTQDGAEQRYLSNILAPAEIS